VVKETYKPINGNIFVVGNMRSGTSLISRLFDGHPEVLSLTGETHFFTQIDERRKIKDSEQYYLWLVGRAFNHAEQRKQAYGTLIDPKKNYDMRSFWKAMLDAVPDGKELKNEMARVIERRNEREIFFKIVEITERLFWPYTERPRFVIEKTPSNEFHLGHIFDFFASAKIIHIVRDPFDTIESFLKGKTLKNQRGKLVNGINTWKRSLQAGLQYARKYPCQYRFVRFEDLVEKPESVMRTLAQFLGITYEDSLLAPTTLSGKALWKSHSHQTVDVPDGKIEKRLLEKDARPVLGDDFLRVIGALVGPEYKACGWSKYAEHIEKSPVSGLLYSIHGAYPNKHLRKIAETFIIYAGSVLALRKSIPFVT